MEEHSVVRVYDLRVVHTTVVSTPRTKKLASEAPDAARSKNTCTSPKAGGWKTLTRRIILVDAGSVRVNGCT